MKNEANPTNIPRLGSKVRGPDDRYHVPLPDDDIPFFFYHEKMHVMVFTDERMRNEMQEDIRK